MFLITILEILLYCIVKNHKPIIMKTIFSEDEIIDFIAKMTKVLQGENILFGTQSKIFLEDIKNHVDAFSHVQECGRAEGRMYARIEFIESLIEFFELKNTLN